MYYSKERLVTIECSNGNCENYGKHITIGIKNIDSEDVKNILTCPKCGKNIRIIKTKKQKSL